MFFLKFFFFLDGKPVVSMFCNVIMLLLLYVHVCVTRTGWETRPRPKTVIFSIKKSNQSNQSLSLSLFSLQPERCRVNSTHPTVTLGFLSWVALFLGLSLSDFSLLDFSMIIVQGGCLRNTVNLQNEQVEFTHTIDVHTKT